MNVSYAPHFEERLRELPIEVQKKFGKQVSFLLIDFRYPSLQVKKYGGLKDVWQARVDKDYRFYFRVKTEVYELVDICRHPSN